MENVIFRVVSSFPRYISCYISENRLPLGQCTIIKGGHILSAIPLLFSRAGQSDVWTALFFLKNRSHPTHICFTFPHSTHYFATYFLFFNNNKLSLFILLKKQLNVFEIFIEYCCEQRTRKGSKGSWYPVIVGKLHCPKNNLNLRIKTEPATVQQIQWYSLCLASGQKPDMNCSIRSRRDRVGLYAEIQIIFGIVYCTVELLMSYNNNTVIINRYISCQQP